MKAGLRAKILFRAPMQALIDERCRDFSAQLRARSLLDSWLCLEMARASVKIDVAHELLTINQERVLGRVETQWDEDAAAREDRRAKGLQDQPYDVARELGRSKHGTLLLISRWEALGEAVAANQRLDEAQIQMAYDLLAIPKVLRNGSRQVPAADNAPALLALVERELGRHRANLERSLNAADQSDREMARLTIVKERDSVTRGLKADLSRAERRFKWAEEVFHRLRQGVDPATIIDPDTKAPIKPDAPAAPASEPEPAPAAAETPPPPTTPTAPEAQTESPQRPLPKDCSELDAEMLRVIAEAIAESRRPSGAARASRGRPGLRAVPRPPTPALPPMAGRERYPAQAAVRARRTVFCRFSGS